MFAEHTFVIHCGHLLSEPFAQLMNICGMDNSFNTSLTGVTNLAPSHPNRVSGLMLTLLSGRAFFLSVFPLLPLPLVLFGGESNAGGISEIPGP